MKGGVWSFWLLSSSSVESHIFSALAIFWFMVFFLIDMILIPFDYDYREFMTASKARVIGIIIATVAPVVRLKIYSVALSRYRTNAGYSVCKAGGRELYP